MSSRSYLYGRITVRLGALKRSLVACVGLVALPFALAVSISASVRILSLYVAISIVEVCLIVVAVSLLMGDSGNFGPECDIEDSQTGVV